MRVSKIGVHPDGSGGGVGGGVGVEPLLGCTGTYGTSGLQEYVVQA